MELGQFYRRKTNAGIIVEVKNIKKKTCTAITVIRHNDLYSEKEGEYDANLFLQNYELCAEAGAEVKDIESYYDYNEE